MVIKCCVPNCVSKYTKGGPVRFHRFPREKNTFTIWCAKLRLCANIIKLQLHYVCSKHFLPSDYIDSFGGKLYIINIIVINNVLSF